MSILTNGENKKALNRKSKYGHGLKSPAPAAVKLCKKEDKSQHYRGIIFLDKERKTNE